MLLYLTSLWFLLLLIWLHRLIQALQSASGMYRNLNSLAMRLTKKGGLLMTCSCSGAMTQSGTYLHVLQACELKTVLYGDKLTIS